jgi:hypothetical protein
MSKAIFYLVYILVGLSLVVLIPPYLKYKKYLKNKIYLNRWLEKFPTKYDKDSLCIFCHSGEMFEQVEFILPKSVEKNLLKFTESVDYVSFVSVRCKRCQTECGRKIVDV